MRMYDQGKAVLRIVNDMCGFLRDFPPQVTDANEPDLKSLLADLKTLAEVGLWLTGTPSIGEERTLAT